MDAALHILCSQAALFVNEQSRICCLFTFHNALSFGDAFFMEKKKLKSPEAFRQAQNSEETFCLDVLLAESNRVIEIIDVNLYHRVSMPGCLQVFGEKNNIQLNPNLLV